MNHKHEHQYGDPVITDAVFVDNGAFCGYAVGRERTCPCGNVLSTTTGEPLKGNRGTSDTKGNHETH